MCTRATVQRVQWKNVKESRAEIWKEKLHFLNERSELNQDVKSVPVQMMELM